MRINLESKNHLDFHVIDNQKRDLILILPGGGYSFTSPREANPVAKVFQSAGYHTAIYYYRETKLQHPMAHQEGLSALKCLRKMDNIGRIFVCGFSAGGHLAASLLIYHANHLSGGILSYPVITADPRYAHQGSIRNLLGNDCSTSRMKEVSLERNVHSKVPPVFIWHTMDDSSVPVENSMLFMAALKKKNVKVETHYFASGAHGLSLASKETPFDDMDPVVFEEQNKHIAIWFQLALTFLKKI
ncbi:MAG: alpha/beta hydrolase [Acholeplasmataceae bacterium]|nr:alpha/beta hydrolase [Acholeplasmataceae bacterium]